MKQTRVLGSSLFMRGARSLLLVLASVPALVSAYRVPPAALARSTAPIAISRASSARSITLCAPPPEEGAEGGAPSSPIAKARAWVTKYAKIDKAQIASLGFDAFFTYGLVSNANGGTDARRPHAHSPT